jgi:hypothetical protein
MSEKNWTPGPWKKNRYGELRGLSGQAVVTERPPQRLPRRGDKVTIAAGAGFQTAMNYSTDQVEANTNLVISSLSLYDALEWAMRYVEQVRAETETEDGFVSDGERIGYRKAVEAMKQARGEAKEDGR